MIYITCRGAGYCYRGCFFPLPLAKGYSSITSVQGIQYLRAIDVTTNTFLSVFIFPSFTKLKVAELLNEVSWL